MPAREEMGVDTNLWKAHLYEVAKWLGIQGRSRMSKAELVETIGRANDMHHGRRLRQSQIDGARASTRAAGARAEHETGVLSVVGPRLV